MSYAIMISLILLNLNCWDNMDKKISLAPNVYPVYKIQESFEIDGKGSQPVWAKAAVLDRFSYPWRNEEAPTTVFRALYNDTHLYFLYWAEDEAIITKNDSSMGIEREVVNSDRVEIFFKANDEMNPYYSLEMDAQARVLDTEGRYYRNIDMDWSWPEGGLHVKSKMEKNGYWLEGMISFASLKALGMHNGNDLQAGLYRGEYVYDDKVEVEVKWISWIQPDSEHPDFHIPSSFGILRLME